MSAYVLFNGEHTRKRSTNATASMIRSTLFNWSAKLASKLCPTDQTHYHVMEYHGILHGWTITATRKGWDRAELLKTRCELARPFKLFKVQRDIIDLPFTA